MTFPLALRRCLLEFKEGLKLFQYVLKQMTNVLRQKSYVFGFGGKPSHTFLEVRIFVFCFNSFDYSSSGS